jgi:oligoendopeptidase F
VTTQTLEKTKAPRWDLESVFPGGSASEEYRAFLQGIAAEMDTAARALKDLPQSLEGVGAEAWAKWILSLQDTEDRLDLVRVFAGCLISQNVDDSRAAALVSETTQLKSHWLVLRSSLESFAKAQSDRQWETLMARDDLAPVRFYLDELRDNARIKMSEEKEKLALELAVDGYHAWYLQYEKIAGDLRIEVDDNGAPKTISLGQNVARMASPDRAIRRDAFVKMEDAWRSCTDLAAMALNAQAGFRLSLYRNRDWDSPLIEPLQYSRLKQKTLDAMWRAIADGGSRIGEYVEAKKRLCDIDRFCWYDHEAPVGKIEKSYTFDEAGAFIAEHLGSFSEEMGEFVRHALESRWVEAEDRPGKRGGAWCSWLPIRKQARIFMTFSGNYDSLSTLAHELGHAYHGSVLKDEPGFNQQYPMTLAETASIFNELRVTDAALAASNSRDEKLALLDQKLQAALIFFCNIRARFTFDTRFYAERKKSVIPADRLSEMMRQAQKDCYFGILDEEEGYHPLFWASKLHFFVTEMPFYNYPYTFGYLFAKGVYNRALEEGPAFAKSYRALLADTGKMTTEQVAQRHLGVDLTKPEFWDTAVAAALADLNEFVTLANE